METKQADVKVTADVKFTKEQFLNAKEPIGSLDALYVVLEDGNTNAEISARNIAGVKTARTNTINVYDILKYNTVIATKAAVATI